MKRRKPKPKDTYFDHKLTALSMSFQDGSDFVAHRIMPAQKKKSSRRLALVLDFGTKLQARVFELTRLQGPAFQARIDRREGASLVFVASGFGKSVSGALRVAFRSALSSARAGARQAASRLRTLESAQARLGKIEQA